MANLSETGHAKNVANFGDLIRRVEASGNYTPSRPSLQLPSLTQYLAQAKAALQTVTTTYPGYTAAVDAREAAWRNMDKLVTRALNIFKASVSNSAETETAMSLVRKIRGTGVRKKTASEAEATAATRKISVSQQSYDLTTQNFGQFIEVLAAHPLYNPNEEELKMVSLRDMLRHLKTVSNNVAYAKAALDAARTHRNNILYGKDEGITNIAKGVKDYVRGAFRPDAIHYKTILSIRFHGQ